MKRNRNGELGMTLIALMGTMAVFAVALLAVAPSVYTEIQREKELEAIRRGEEVAEAIRQYVEFYGGGKLPTSMDELLEGLPAGTKKRQILRPSAAVDPLSEDGRWRLIKPDPNSIGSFARRVQNYNGGLLPANPSPLFDKFAVQFVSVLNTELDSDNEGDSSFDMDFDNTPFIGVASQSLSKSIITYYGIENHSRWVFTPLFRGSGRNVTQSPQTIRNPPVRE
ncbi:MAG: type II secretion system protein [Acidobacteriota bacterium]|nr:MAG: type II secretion system protein [Acidobacteriota bacterium]